MKGVGPGKVHVTETTSQLVLSNIATSRGQGVTRQVEDLTNLRPLTILERMDVLRTPNGAIEYIAAIMGTFADIADRQYAKAGKPLRIVTIPPLSPDTPDDIRNNPSLLAAFYHGVKSGGVQIDLVSAPAYFRGKAESGKGYELRPDRAHFMDLLVYDHLPMLGDGP